MNANGGVVVTGASTGIGRACALDLAQRGLRVFAGVRKQAVGKKLEEQAVGRLESIILDITDEEHIQRAVQRVSESLAGEPLVGLLNNAGITVNGPLEFVPLGELRRQLEVNVVAQLALTQAFLPKIRQAEGRIVLMGSVAGLVAMPGLGPYCMSKHAIEAMADVLRLELKPFGIHVSLIEPGHIDTPIWQKGFDDWEAFKKQAGAGLEELYAHQISRVHRLAAKFSREAMPPSVVTAAVAHALISQRPRTRYLIGGGARQQRFLSRLPDSWRDRILGRILRF